MNIDITSLKNHSERELVIHETYHVSKEQLENTELLDLKDVMVEGTLNLDVNQEYEMHVTVTGTMILPCAITLKPVPYQFSIEVDGNVEEMLNEIDKNHEKIENTIDISPIIWENILMEIPLRVVSEELDDVSLEGDGWKLITERETNLETNPELEKLKDLL